MNITNLCEKIDLQPELKTRVLAFADEFDFSSVEAFLKDFRCYEKMSGALAELCELLGDDPDGIRILVCMLQASADLYEFYAQKGIGDTVYFDTMKCYTRFIYETCRVTGRLCFDRWWWTTRQAGGHLFRIGALEYEIKPLGGGTVIGIHIPSDADFSPAAVDESLRSAKAFFAEHYPELANAEYRCHSWLLDGRLREMLDEDSNIADFQSRFEIFDEGEIGDDFLKWLFYTDSADYASLPENTTLQRNVKKHLLSGGVIRNAYGRLIIKTDGGIK